MSTLPRPILVLVLATLVAVGAACSSGDDDAGGDAAVEADGTTEGSDGAGGLSGGAGDAEGADGVGGSSGEGDSSGEAAVDSDGDGVPDASSDDGSGSDSGSDSGEDGEGTDGGGASDSGAGGGTSTTAPPTTAPPTTEAPAAAPIVLALNSQRCSGRPILSITAGAGRGQQANLRSVTIERQNEFGAWLSSTARWLGPETGAGDQWTGEAVTGQRFGTTLRITARSNDGQTRTITAPVTGSC
jgi:hypothetical protein